ncbi:MAG TPA: hypothetical protein VMR17_06395 [Xanthobacteraceae bacterium]|nr:hypothetical protein [Xanthobacteraceae bacterium]
MLPSFYVSGDKARAWSVTRAALYGALLGLAAALLKTLAPLHQAIAVSVTRGENLLAHIPEIVGATVGFALLCSAAAALRNVLARRLIWPEIR